MSVKLTDGPWGTRAPVNLVVTTCYKPTPGIEGEARAVAEVCGVVYSARRSVATLEASSSASGPVFLYVVGRARHEIRVRDDVLFVHPGLYQLKRMAGREHPLLRALSPHVTSELHTVFDGTLGLAADAVHVAGLLGVKVVGIESSPILASLTRDGLRRMASQTRKWAAGAGRVQVEIGDALEALRGQATDAMSAVYLDPMFSKPAGAHQSFGVLRALADHKPLTEDLLIEAQRVAQRRVVLKIPGASAVPDVSPGPPGWNRRVRGGAVDYLVCEMELEQPEWDAPDTGRLRLRRATRRG